MKIAVCSAQSYGHQFLSEVNRKFEYELAFFGSHLYEGTRRMVAGFPAVCVHQRYAGCTGAGSRCAGFNNVDISARSTIRRVPCSARCRSSGCAAARRAGDSVMSWQTTRMATAADLIHVGVSILIAGVVCWLTFYMACPVGLGNTTGMKPKSNAGRRVLFPS
jgi:hypothetical protein